MVLYEFASLVCEYRWGFIKHGGVAKYSKFFPLHLFSSKVVVLCQGYFKVIALVLGTKVCKFESYLRRKEVSECDGYFIEWLLIITFMFNPTGYNQEFPVVIKST